MTMYRNSTARRRLALALALAGTALALASSGAALASPPKPGTGGCGGCGGGGGGGGASQQDLQDARQGAANATDAGMNQTGSGVSVGGSGRGSRDLTGAIARAGAGQDADERKPPVDFLWFSARDAQLGSRPVDGNGPESDDDKTAKNLLDFGLEGQGQPSPPTPADNNLPRGKQDDDNMGFLHNLTDDAAGKAQKNDNEDEKARRLKDLQNFLTRNPVPGGLTPPPPATFPQPGYPGLSGYFTRKPSEWELGASSNPPSPGGGTPPSPQPASTPPPSEPPPPEPEPPAASPPPPAAPAQPPADDLESFGTFDRRNQ